MVDIHPALAERLTALEREFEAAEAALLDPSVLANHTLVRDHSLKRSSLFPLVRAWRALQSAQARIRESDALLKTESDEDLRDLARAERAEALQSLSDLTEEVKQRLVRSEDDAVGALILEIRAGVGGDEAALFAGDLLDMYSQFASGRSWLMESLEQVPGEQGGVRVAIMSVEGEGAWSSLGYEGGTHQVKRVPATETKGRVHTSTATVAVLPQPREVEIDLNPADVKEMITTATGPGGQNVNKVSTAVHLIHEPTGTEVRMQDTKSQSQNRQKAWKLLQARLFESQRRADEAARAAERSAMIGTGSRAEKIRTYRWKESLVMDHRLGRSFPLQPVLSGGLDSIVEALTELDVARRLESM
ncbi:MAG: PCRF domain-containing protein [Phycisphaerales bacterium]|nr:PCRF domain-containing protein [Phycisphaerales bacterium]